jgi:hypothetical protein
MWNEHLHGTSTEPFRSAFIFGWAIRMQTDSGYYVRVLVTDEALQDMASPPDSGIDRLKEHREQIEAIASAKHAAGQIEADGTVRVTAPDLR